MNNKMLIQKFRKMPWEHWLKRRYPVLVPYLMARGAAKQAFARCGIKGEWPIILFERGVWYGTPEMFELAGKDAEKYLKKLGAAFLTKVCSLGYKKAMLEISRMLKDTKTPSLAQYKKVVDLLEPINVSVWTAHASEVYLDNILRKRLAKYVAVEKLDEYIGDVGFPKRKNAHALLVTDVLKGIEVEKLHEKYGWMKSRTDAGFGYGYTLTEMKELRRDILNNPPVRHTYPRVPSELKSLVKELQEMVYLRTLRSDCLFEIYFRSAPIFARLEKELNIDSVGHYLPEDLIAGKSNRYDDQNCAVLKYYDDIVVTKEKIVKERNIGEQEIKGVIAWKGKVRGRVRVVFSPTEAHLVKSGEILVTNMTVPAYLLAMKKAAAFITDEGGITCHAAIIAREMKKPCVIGTKIATRVLKDGDMVEVDAEKGVVRILEKLSNKEIQEYHKLMNRSFPLIFFECWYEGEKFGLPKISNDSMFFDPLFIYRKNKGADVLYNFTDMKQDPKLLVGYFADNFNRLKSIAEKHLLNYKYLVKVLKNKKINFLEKIKKTFNLSLDMFPVLTSMVVIGNNSEESAEIVKLSNQIRTESEDFVYQAIDILLVELAKILPDEYKDFVSFITYSEATGKLPDIQTLEQRKNGYIYYQGVVYAGMREEEFAKNYNLNIVEDKIIAQDKDNELRGKIAYKGRVIGKVKVVFEVSDMKKIRQGDVLVTSMTTPDLVAVSHDFAAIVTDEGGITCHAAIIAREMKKPCVIGTRIATRVLKDGDMVEVDADNGVVRKI